MNYQIIKDKELFLSFIDFLPQLAKNECFFLTLLARKKYTSAELPKTECQIKRFYASKEHLYDKVKQLECEMGTYKFNDIEVPADSMVLYLNPNPRCFKKAAKNTLIELAKTIDQDVNPNTISMNCIQTAIGTKHFVHLEYDASAVEDFLVFAEDKINRNAMTIIKTRGGFHVLIKPKLVEPQFIKKWYQALTSFEGIDVKNDQFCPVVGACQSTFMPYIVE